MTPKANLINMRVVISVTMQQVKVTPLRLSYSHFLQEFEQKTGPYFAYHLSSNSKQIRESCNVTVASDLEVPQGN